MKLATFSLILSLVLASTTLVASSPVDTPSDLSERDTSWSEYDLLERDVNGLEYDLLERDVNGLEYDLLERDMNGLEHDLFERDTTGLEYDLFERDLGGYDSADLLERDFEPELYERDITPFESDLYERDIATFESDLYERDITPFESELYERDITPFESDLYERDITPFESDLYERDFAPYDSSDLFERDLENDLYERAAPKFPSGPGGRGSGGAEIGTALANLAQGLQDEPKARGEFVKKLLDTHGKKHPGFQIIVCHPKHSYKFEGKQGKDWGHDHAEFQRTAVPGSYGYEIYWFKKGWFNNEKDGGWLNWGYTGSPKREGNKLTYK